MHASRTRGRRFEPIRARSGHYIPSLSLSDSISNKCVLKQVHLECATLLIFHLTMLNCVAWSELEVDQVPARARGHVPESWARTQNSQYTEIPGPGSWKSSRTFFAEAR